VAGTRFAWRRIWLLAVWLVRTGDRVRKNLSGPEWQELRGLTKKGLTGKSKRSPWKNLSQKELVRLRTLVGRAVTGKGRKDGKGGK
jgi:hypothetical protein